MKPAELESLARRLREGEVPQGVTVLKHNPVRHVVRADGVVLKVFLTPSRRPAREGRALRKATALGVPVPRLLGVGRDWVATGFIEGRTAVREDLPRILPVVDHMHSSGMLHRDLHLGNRVPGPLRERALERYLERGAFRGNGRELRKAVISQSLRRAHRWHGC